MKCPICGEDTIGTFCSHCGASTSEKTEAREYEAYHPLLMDRTEKIKAILCNGFAKTFLSTGVLGNGFALLTDKRVYYKGKCYVRQGKGFYSKLEENTVDLEDVTGTGFVYNKATWAKILSIIFFVTACTLGLPIILNGMLGHKMHGGILSTVATYVCLGLLFYFLYKRYNYSVFQISFAGGAIAFDMNWVTQQETKEFQRQLVLLKQEKNKGHHKDHDEDNSDMSLSSQLKELKSLLDQNLITQEEYDAKKKQLLDI